MYCQKCGLKVHKHDKYCGHCGKSLLQKNKETDEPQKMNSNNIYKHGLDTVFGYAPVPDYKERVSLMAEVMGDLNEDSEPSSDESLMRKTLQFSAAAFKQPFKVIRSKEVYPVSVVLLNALAFLILGSIFLIDITEAVINPDYYLDYIYTTRYYFIDIFHVFNVAGIFFGNLIVFGFIYVSSIILNGLIGLKDDYGVFNFRDIVIFTSIGMVINILGSFLVLIGIDTFGYILSYIGVMLLLTSPLLLSIFYALSGKTNLRFSKIAAIILMATAGIMIIIYAALFFTY